MDKSMWEDLQVEYTVECERECRVFLRLLEEAKLGKFLMQARFEEEYQLVEFEREWKLQMSNEMEEDSEEKKRKRAYRYLLKRPQGYPQDEIMKLGRDTYRGEIFMEAFHEDLKRIEIEYDYKLYCDSNNLRIFMPENSTLNTICRNKLMELKNSLSVFYTQNTAIITMIRSSALLRQQLTRFAIVTWLKYLRGNLWVMFYSTTLKDFEIREKVQEVVRFDIAVISINHRSLKLTEVECVFWLLQTSLAEGVESIKEVFEMEVEFNEEFQSIVIHHQHSSFSMEPQAYVRQLLDSLVIFSVKSKSIKEFDNKVKKASKQLPFLYSKMNAGRNETFLCISVDKLNQVPEKLREKYIQGVVKLFLEIVEEQLEIKVYFAHFHQYQKEMQEVLLLAENSSLTIANFDRFYDFSQLKGVFRLKDYSEIISLKRQKEVAKFIEGLITKNYSQQNDSIADRLFNEDSMLQSSDVSSFHLQNLSLVQDNRGKYPWLKLGFVMPEFKDYGDEVRAYVKERRERELERLFNQQGRFKFKIWKLELSAHIQRPTEVIDKEPLLIKKPFFGRDLNRQMDVCSLQDFKVHEEGAIAFETRELRTDFIPICLFERIE